jgi:hypothetical protein
MLYRCLVLRAPRFVWEPCPFAPLASGETATTSPQTTKNLPLGPQYDMAQRNMSSFRSSSSSSRLPSCMVSACEPDGAPRSSLLMTLNDGVKGTFTTRNTFGHYDPLCIMFSAGSTAQCLLHCPVLFLHPQPQSDAASSSRMKMPCELFILTPHWV